MPPPTIGGIEKLCFRVIYPAVVRLSVHPSVNIRFASRDAIPLNLVDGFQWNSPQTNIRHVDGHCGKGFQGQRSKMARSVELYWRRHTFSRLGVARDWCFKYCQFAVRKCNNPPTGSQPVIYCYRAVSGSAADIKFCV